jgi:hypothetical protein
MKARPGELGASSEQKKEKVLATEKEEETQSSVLKGMMEPM